MKILFFYIQIHCKILSTHLIDIFFKYKETGNIA